MIGITLLSLPLPVGGKPAEGPGHKTNQSVDAVVREIVYAYRG